MNEYYSNECLLQSDYCDSDIDYNAEFDENEHWLVVIEDDDGNPLGWEEIHSDDEDEHFDDPDYWDDAEVSEMENVVVNKWSTDGDQKVKIWLFMALDHQNLQF
jgi:hypothetical protein